MHLADYQKYMKQELRKLKEKYIALQYSSHNEQNNQTEDK